ncbi:MAG: hypothetical protein IPK81_10695 [Rhodospirillales bacterium]|nr:MAG: hypothetical protein IPK81_10695 [Rhodospirillales bacterium]
MTASGRSPRGFAVHRLADIPARPRRDDWNYRFVCAVLLLYGCVGAAFFLVEWTSVDPAAYHDVEPAPVERLDPAAHRPRGVRLPRPEGETR